MKKLIVIGALSVLAFATSASAQGFGMNTPRYSSDVYDATETRNMQDVTLGTVEDVRIVHIKDESTNDASRQYAGTALGAAAGGLMGSRVGRGNGRLAAIAVGTVAGGWAGSELADSRPRMRPAVEVIVTIEKSGWNNAPRRVAIVQELAGERLHPGDRVRVIQGRAMRVVRVRHELSEQPTVLLRSSHY